MLRSTRRAPPRWRSVSGRRKCGPSQRRGVLGESMGYAHRKIISHPRSTSLHLQPFIQSPARLKQETFRAVGREVTALCNLTPRTHIIFTQTPNHAKPHHGHHDFSHKLPLNSVMEPCGVLAVYSELRPGSNHAWKRSTATPTVPLMCRDSHLSPDQALIYFKLTIKKVRQISPHTFS